MSQDGWRRRDEFAHLAQLLLSNTVAAEGQSIAWVRGQSPDAPTRLLTGRGGTVTEPIVPIKLRDGRFLRLGITLRVEVRRDGAPPTTRVVVVQSSFQYQGTRDGIGSEIFRYDFLRVDDSRHPNAHLNVFGSQPVASPSDKPLERVHFPTSRVSLEAIIRCLAEQYGVGTKVGSEIWRPALAESERQFLSIAHQPASGPSS